MNIKNKHFVITGGTTGIGFQLTKELISLGNEVLAVDYSEENIKKAQAELPQLNVLKADLSKSEERIQLVKNLEKEFPEYDILINNAGIQKWINLQTTKEDWSYYQQELKINLEAPMHLSLLVLDHLKNKQESAIINVSSGLVITPGVWVPFYTAAKSGLHGFTQTLRLQSQDTNVKVFEVFPPAVNTSLGGSSEHAYGVDTADFVQSVILQLQNDSFDITFGTSKEQYKASKKENEEVTQKTWNMFKNSPIFLNL